MFYVELNIARINVTKRNSAHTAWILTNTVSFFAFCGPSLHSKHCSLSVSYWGIGFAMIMVAFLCTVYYNVIVAWVLYYMYASVREDVPWRNCGNPWNTDLCVKGARKRETNLFLCYFFFRTYNQRLI